MKSVAVAVYVVVAAGLTLTVPAGACLPTPGSISTLTAFCDCQVKAEVCPAEICMGLAVMETASVPGGGTVTVVWAVWVPPGPAAVAVYVVVVAGCTVMDPFSGCAPIP